MFRRVGCFAVVTVILCIVGSRSLFYPVYDSSHQYSCSSEGRSSQGGQARIRRRRVHQMETYRESEAPVILYVNNMKK